MNIFTSKAIVAFFISAGLAFLMLLSSTAQAKVYQTGISSWYGPGFHGRTMANGKKFNQWSNSVAHRKLPFGTKIKITNLKTGKYVIGYVHDRGPYKGNRVLDVSKGLAKELGMLQSGLAKVSIKVLYIPNKKTKKSLT